MKVKSVLFPTDFSELSQAALPYAVSLARDFDAELLIAHVIEPGAVYSFGGVCFCGDTEPNYSSVKQMLAQIVPADKGLRFRHALLTGSPAKSIVQLKDGEQMAVERVDEIVLVLQKQRRQRAQPRDIRFIELENASRFARSIESAAALIGRRGGWELKEAMAVE